MPLPQDLTKFTTASPQVVSYSFTETLTGTAYGTFYGGFSPGQNDFLVSSSEINSDGLSSGGGYFRGIVTYDNNGTGSNGVYINTFERDYTTSFNISQTIEGVLIVSFSHGIYGVSSVSGAYKTEITIEKNGVALVGSAETGGKNFTVSEGNDSIPGAVSFNIPKTHFAIGDILKVNVKGWCYGDVTGRRVHYGIGTDPGERNDIYGAKKIIADTDSTQLKVLILFRTTDSMAKCN